MTPPRKFLIIGPLVLSGFLAAEGIFVLSMGEDSVRILAALLLPLAAMFLALGLQHLNNLFRRLP